MFASEVQSGIHSIQEWANAGVGNVRIELVDEGKVQNIVNAYLKVLACPQEIIISCRERKRFCFK